MKEQLDRLNVNDQKSVRVACEQLVKVITKELQTLQERACKLEVEEHCSPEPSCTLQEHISKLHEYEDLQSQHKLSLEACELLRKQNVRLQTQIADLLARQSSHEAPTKVHTMSRPENDSPWQAESRMMSDSASNLMKDHPELQAIFVSQSLEYTKLQRAHGVLLSKLKEYQEVITQLRSQNISYSTEDTEDEARLAHLRTIIGSTKKSSHSSTTSTRVSPVSPTSLSTPSTTSPSEHNHGIIQALVETGKATTIRSSPSEASNGYAKVEKKKNESMTEATPDLPVSSRTFMLPVNDSLPEFVSERPVKRRRIGKVGIENRVTKMVKTEVATMEHGLLDEGQASIDLDVIHTPIILPGRRSEELRRRESPDDNIRRNTTQRYSEPLRTLSDASIVSHSSITAVTTTGGLGFVKNEPIVLHPVDVEDSQMSPPRSVLSRWNTYLQGTPQRPVLQSKTTNTRILNQVDIPTAHTKFSYAKENIQANELEDSAIETRSKPIASLARKALSPSRSAAKLVTPESRHQPPPVTSTKKYQTTPVQRIRNNQDLRLRQKDIGELSINDFILNPAMNQGFNQAFGLYDPSKETRNCAPDCSKPECCGNALAAAIKSAGISSLHGMSSLEKDGLIRSYLGFPVSKLGNISEHAYQKLLGEAMGKQFAAKYGKQQQVRADSPPGYWRVDFPSTQERVADGKKAEEIEQVAIAERRREALRDGGLWVFRDE